MNEPLLLSGFQVLADGRIPRARPRVTLAEAQQRADELRAELACRDVHPDVLAFCRAELLSTTTFTLSWRRPGMVDKPWVLTG